MAEDAVPLHIPQPQAERAAPGAQIGVNVAWFSGSRSNNLVLFINQIKGARPWDDPFNLGTIRYDANGYPTLIPGAYVVSQLLIRSSEVKGISPHDGRFRLYGAGVGRFSLVSTTDGPLVTKRPTRILPREEIGERTLWYIDFDFQIDADEPVSQIKMQIDQIARGNHIRDLALVHHDHLEAFRAGQFFAPELAADLEVYGALRLMDWMRANRIEEAGNGWGEEGSDWSSPTPEQRFVTPDFYTFNNHAGGRRNEGRFEVSVPIEHIVALANRTGADPWITLPVDITDARAAQLARYVTAHLQPELTPRWEYGNELFNSAIGFEGYRYALRMARLTFDADLPDGPDTAAEWAAYRGPQLYQIIQDQSDRAARFVAPGWAFSGALTPDGGQSPGYLVRYFAAEQSRALGDGTPLPLDIVTDYAVALYFGGTLAPNRPDTPVVQHILDTVQGAEAQADMLAHWLLFGAGPAGYIQLTRDALQRPITNVPNGADIGVAPLIAGDVAAGLDPLSGLGQILRIEGTRLQYRGVQSDAWRDVLQFSAAPPALETLINQVQLVGHGGRLSGRAYSGLRTGLAAATAWRIDAHHDYAKALGLNFVAYEGGSHVSKPPEGAEAMFEAFNAGAASARVLDRWLQIMRDKGVGDYLHFMSHSRTDQNDWWGVQDYIGQPLADSAKARVLSRAMTEDRAASSGFTGPLQNASTIQVTPTGQLRTARRIRWQDASPWTLGPDGTATETAGDTRQLRLTAPLPILPGASYKVRFDVTLIGADQTELRVVARALGHPATELIRWQNLVTDGDTVTFPLGPFAQGQRAITLAIQRVGQARDGAITVSNARLLPN